MAEAGERLHVVMTEAMDALGMSVLALGRAAGISPGMFYRWWNGKQQPRISSLERVAKPLGLAPQALASLPGRCSPSARGDTT